MILLFQTSHSNPTSYLNNVRQSRNTVDIFKVEFRNIAQCRNNVVHMNISKKLKNDPRVQSNKMFLSFKYNTLNSKYTLNTLNSNFQLLPQILVHFIPNFQKNDKKNICKTSKFLKTS